MWGEHGSGTEERFVGGIGAAGRVQCRHGRDHPRSNERSKLRSGLKELRNTPMKDTDRESQEGQGNTRRGWCPKGKQTESCKEEGSSWSDSGKAK